MKFGQALNFNTVPEWKDFYINYSLLKRLVHEEEERAARGGGAVSRGRPSLGERACLFRSSGSTV